MDWPRSWLSVMPNKLSLSHNSFLRWIGYATALCTLVGSLWGGKAVLDSSYAGAAETRQKFDSLELFLRKKDLRDLKRERGELERIKETMGLSGYEKGRLKEIVDEIKALEHELNPGKK